MSPQQANDHTGAATRPTGATWGQTQVTTHTTYGAVTSTTTASSPRRGAGRPRRAQGPAPAPAPEAPLRAQVRHDAGARTAGPRIGALLPLHLQIEGGATGRARGFLHDIGWGGARIETVAPLRLGDTVTVDIVVDGGTVTLCGDVMRAELNGSGMVVALRFCDQETPPSSRAFALGSVAAATGS